jgi:Etoposide-induced protein 2.4 (EI24)
MSFFTELAKNSSYTIRRFLSVINDLKQERRLLRTILLPYLIGIPVFMVIVLLALFYRYPLTQLFLGDINLFAQAAVVRELIQITCALFVALVVTFIAVISTLQFYLEKTIKNTLNNRGYAIKQSRSVFNYVLRTVTETVVRFIIIGFLALLMLLTIILPPVSLFFGLLTSLYIGFDIFAMGLSSVGLTIKEQFNVLGGKIRRTLEFGLIVGLVLGVPFIGLMILPIAFIVSSEFIADWADEGEELIKKNLVKAEL